MNISINNSYGSYISSKMVLFTGIPNILKVESNSTAGQPTTFTITIGDFQSTVTEDGQYYISLLDDTIWNTTETENAVNKNFIVSTPVSTAVSITKALRNCPSINNMFVVYMSSLSSPEITLKSRRNLPIDGTVTTNIGLSYITITKSIGTSSDELLNAKVGVDVLDSNGYVTTLEKNAYDGECCFNISSVLSKIANYDKVEEFTLHPYVTQSDGSVTALDNYNMKTAIGYAVNQGDNYKIMLGDSIAQNVLRGDNSNGGAYNTSYLYTYKPEIVLSIYSVNTGSRSIEIQYVDSANNIITSETKTYTVSNTLQTFYISLNETYFNQSFYIDILAGVGGRIRYEVIKPLKATPTSQRIYFHNSYGGVSFFDFTGERTEDKNMSYDTYQKNLFGYYDTDDLTKRLNVNYDRDISLKVKLKSHLIAKNGTYIFNDLVMSKDVWTTVNTVKYSIIITDCSVAETDVEGIYEVTVGYEYSQPTSFI